MFNQFSEIYSLPMVSCRRNVHFCKNHVFYLGATPILQTLVILANLGFLSPGIKFACAGADKSRFTVLFSRRRAHFARIHCYLQYILLSGRQPAASHSAPRALQIAPRSLFFAPSALNSRAQAQTN